MPNTVVYSFAGYTLHATRRELRQDGLQVELGSRALDVLLALVRRAGEVATKGDIMAEVWPGVVVEENNLTTQIAAVRRALGEGGGRRFILTVPGRGYRFVADLTSDAETIEPSGPGPDRARATEPPAERHNLPVESSSFIGREAELQSIRDRLESRALVTLVGAGGIGKTRVALRAAEALLDRFTDGVLLLDLAPLGDSPLVAEALCRLLGVAATEGRLAQDAAVAMLRRRNMLLLLDSCEHVLSGAATLASALLRQCPGVKVLATSREALSVPGEAVFLMPSLPVPPANVPLTAEAALQCDSVRLFTERAADALGGYTLTDEDAPLVATICRRLDGMPLATELAAARLRMLKPAEIAVRLENVFRLLTGGSRVALARHQTLRATIDWSFSLLSAAEQAVLARLSVFVDGCSLEGATAVAAGDDIEPDDVFDLVSALVSKSLLVADTAGTATRYRMLETTRQYAAEKLSIAGDGPARCAACTYLLNVFRRAERDWPTQGTDAWLAAYRPEAENLRAAIEWSFGEGDPKLGVALVANAGAVAQELSLRADLTRWTEAALPHLSPAVPQVDIATILYLHTLQQKRLGTHEVAAERLEAIRLFRELGDRIGLSRALRQTAMARAMPGPLNDAIAAMLSEAVALLRPLAPHKDLATALAHTGGMYCLCRDEERARRFNEAAFAMREALADRTGLLASAVNLAEAICLAGDARGALRFARQAEAEARARNAVATLALILSNSAGYLLAMGDADAARISAHEAFGLARAIGDNYLAVLCLEHLGLAAAMAGDLDYAARLIGFTSSQYATHGWTRAPLEQSGFDRVTEILRVGLAEAELASLQEHGSLLPLDLIEVRPATEPRGDPDTVLAGASFGTASHPLLT